MCACFVPMIGMLPLVAFNRRKTDDPRCPLLAQSGHSAAEFQCPLLGVKRTSDRGASMSAFDPKRTFVTPSGAPI